MHPLAYIAALGSAIAWSIQPIFTRSIHADALTHWVLLTLPAATVACILLIVRGRSMFSQMKTPDLVKLILAGCVGSVLGYFLYTYSIMNVSSAHIGGVMVVAFSSPLIVLAYEFAVGKKISAMETFGVALVLLGMFCIFKPSGTE